MTKKQKTILAVGAIVILIFLFLRGKGESPEQQIANDLAVPLVGATNIAVPPLKGITLPSVNLPPRSGPIVWPDLGGLPIAGGYSGITTCGCGDSSTVQYVERPQTPVASAVTSIAKTVTRTLGFSDTAIPKSSWDWGY
jgi:hypothetical protein